MDDLEAVRSIVEILEKFQEKDVKERIIRWSLEKSGLELAAPTFKSSLDAEGERVSHSRPSGGGAGANDIRSFIAQKAPASDNQFAATVAYYYAFEAPEQHRKATITPTDLTEACRMAGRARLGDPAKTLANAKDMGYLDKVDRGIFKLNTVGENLVAMALPGGNAGDSSSRARKIPARKAARGKAAKSGKRR